MANGSFEENSEHFLKYILPWIVAAIVFCFALVILKHCRKSGGCYCNEACFKKSELEEKLIE